MAADEPTVKSNWAKKSAMALSMSASRWIGGRAANRAAGRELAYTGDIGPAAPIVSRANS
jgi:hypothetical protein